MQLQIDIKSVQLTGCTCMFSEHSELFLYSVRKDKDSFEEAKKFVEVSKLLSFRRAAQLTRDISVYTRSSLMGSCVYSDSRNGKIRAQAAYDFLSYFT